MSIKPTQNFNHSVIAKKTSKYITAILLLGLPIANNPVSAAIFNQSDSQLIFQPKSDLDSPIGIGNLNSFYSLNTLKSSKDLEREKLIQKGLEELKKGNKQQGLKDLQTAWEMDTKSLGTGVIFVNQLIKNKKFDQALPIAQQIRNTRSNKDFSIGYSLEGIIHLIKGNLDQATTSFKEALSYSPEDTNALLNLSNIASSRNDIDSAKAYLQQILSFDDTHLKALIKLAKIDFKNGLTKESNNLLKHAITNHPKDSSPSVALAQNYISLKRYQDVLALTEDKTDPVLMELRAKAFHFDGDNKQALANYKKIVESYPKLAPANFLLAGFYTKSQKFDEANTQMQLSISKDSSYLPARIGLIKTLVNIGKIADANKAQKKLLSEFGEKRDVLTISGWLDMQQGKYAQAAQYFEKAAKENVNSELTRWWTQSLWEQKKHDEAIKLMKDWLDKNPKDANIYLTLADSYMILRRNSEAKQAYLKLLELQPEQSGAYNNLAWMEQDTNLDKAIEYGKKGLELDKNNSQILDTLGMLYVRAGNLPEGFKLVSKAAEIAPTRVNIQYHLAEILVMQKNTIEANKVIKKLESFNLSTTLKTRIEELKANLLKQ